MGRYELFFKKSVSKDLRALPRQDVRHILKCFEQLADPRPAGCEKLSGQERYRLRRGIYGIIYEIDDDALKVTVVKDGHRRDACRTKG